jgi:hypothetical protein
LRSKIKKERKQTHMKQIKPAQSYIDQDRAKVLLEKWAPVLDYTSKSVAAIEDDHTRLNTAMLLENQEAYCLREANVAGGAGTMFGSINNGGTGGAFPGGSDSYAPGDNRLPKILIPMIRRTFPELISNEIVGVQPMSNPVGIAFALRYKYSKDTLGGNYQDASQNGTDWQAAPGNPSSGSGQPYRNTTTVNYAASGDNLGSGLPGGAGGKSPQGDNELGWQYLDSRFTGVSAGALSGLGTHAESGVTWNFNAADGGVAEILKNFEINANIPTVEVSFEKTAVEAGTRRLGAKWSVELEQDLKNMNGIDIDAEITNAMAYEIQAEIDREMIIRMIQTSLNGGYRKGFSVWSPSTADGRWLVERNRDFYQRVIIEANRIAIRNRRGAANFIVATPRVCAIFEMLPEFQWVTVQGNVSTQQTGVAKVGSLGGRFQVYRDTRTEVQNSGVYGDVGYGTGTGPEGIEYALLGYKGTEFYDSGIIYCPYIPVMVQRTIGPNDFAPRVGLLTRYGVVDNIFGASLYYHTIILKNLGQAFTPGNQSIYF